MMRRYVVERTNGVKIVAILLGRFHVKRRSLRTLDGESGLESEKVNALFTNAEIAENDVQDVLDIDPPGQLAKCLSCNA